MQNSHLYKIRAKTPDELVGVPSGPHFHPGVEILRIHSELSHSDTIDGPVSFLQRHLRLGYRDAIHLLDELVRCGVISRK